MIAFIDETRGFHGVEPICSVFLAHPHSLCGYDGPEILRYSTRQVGPMGTDAGHLESF
jgi:hypothetical protein